MKIKFTLLLFISCAISAFSQTTLVLQPDSTAGKNAFLDNYPSDNYANTNFYGFPDVDAVAWTAQGEFYIVRSLLQFDLSSIPPGATITGATLTLYNNPTSSQTGGQHSYLSGSNAAWLQRVISPWSKNTVTWNTQPSTTTSDETALPQDTNANENYIVDVTSLTQDMVNNPSSSFGFMLSLQTEVNYRSLIFASCYHPNSALHPKLVITYITGCTNLVLQPNAEVGKNAFLDNYGPDDYANTNFYGFPDVDAVAWTAQGSFYIVRSLLQFDLSSIPAGATISDATLTLYNNPTSSQTGGQHSYLSGSNAAWLQRVISPWSEYTVTWNTQPSATSLNEAMLPQDTNPNENYIVDVTTLTRDMVNNPSSSFGFMLSLQTEVNYRSLIFASCYHADSTLHPKLEICYNVPNLYATTTQLNISCYGNANGNATVTVMHGSSPFTYQWSPGGQTTSSISGLSPGTYVCTVTDAADSSITDTVVITQPGKLMASVSGNLSVCSGHSTTLYASATGGTPSYTFVWDGSSTGSDYPITPVSTGKHYLVAFDSSNCQSDTVTFTITVNPNPVVTLNSIQNTCMDISALILAGGTPPGGTYSGTSVTNNTFYPFVSGPGTFPITYSYTNLYGCTGSVIKSITVYLPPLTPDITESNDTLFCVTDPSYTAYQWYYNGSLIQGATKAYYVFSNSGNYNIEVTDAQGCQIAVGINVVAGIDEIVFNPCFYLYPNPATDNLIIELKEDVISAHLEIYNVMGKNIYADEIKNSGAGFKKQIPLNFPAGIYFVQVSDERSRWVGKFVKE